MKIFRQEYWGGLPFSTPRSGCGKTQSGILLSLQDQSQAVAGLCSLMKALGMLTSPPNSFRLLVRFQALGLQDWAPQPLLISEGCFTELPRASVWFMSDPTFHSQQQQVKSFTYLKFLNFLYSSFSLCLIPPLWARENFLLWRAWIWDGPSDNPG